ncbi:MULTISPECIES: hypothetical protein [unclassified Agrobacterium]
MLNAMGGANVDHFWWTARLGQEHRCTGFGPSGACYLRVDTIEQAISSSTPLAGQHNVGPAGYVALYRVAEDNLRLGQIVIADSINPIEITRAAFRNVATETSSGFIEIEVVCSDVITHRHRAETRSPAIEGRLNPTWAQIQELNLEPWSSDLRVDTFHLSLEESTGGISRFPLSLGNGTDRRADDIVGLSDVDWLFPSAFCEINTSSMLYAFMLRSYFGDESTVIDSRIAGGLP